MCYKHWYQAMLILGYCSNRMHFEIVGKLMLCLDRRILNFTGFLNHLVSNTIRTTIVCPSFVKFRTHPKTSVVNALLIHS